jgi:hypothetical protein
MKPDERRINTRKPLEHLAYLSLPFDNGGIVLDVSEGGLGFHSIAPVEADGPIHFRFAIDSATRIKAVGELAWKDETGKTGGLRFTELPDEIREQIRVWASQPNVKAKARGKARTNAKVIDIPAGVPAIEAGVAASSKADWTPLVAIPAAELATEADASPHGRPELASFVGARNPLLYNLRPPIYSAPAYLLSMFPFVLISQAEATAVAVPQPIAVPQPAVIRHPVAAVGLTIVLALLVSIGILAYVSTSRAGEVLLDWGEKTWGGSASQAVPRDPAPPVSSAPDALESPQR